MVSETAMRQIVLIGGGDHASEIIGAARLSGMSVTGIYDDDSNLWGQSICDVLVKGPVDQAVHTGLPAVLSSADPVHRRELAEHLKLSWVTVIHPKAVVERYAHLELGCVVLDGAVVQPGVRMGAHVVVGAKSTVAHDCILGDYVHMQPGVQLAGYVEVGEGASLGGGAVVIPKVRIGRWSTISVASVLIHDVSDFTSVAGVPAKEITVPTAILSEPRLDYGRMQTG
jgi:acetyltransferase EpsM